MQPRHPSAIFLLCVVQGCERFAFFAMLPLFVVYLQQHLGFTEHAALLILSVFLAVSYLGALPGGALADRRLGSGLAVLLGCALLTLGYSGLALHKVLLWPALALMLIGHGLFKPGIFALVGGLYVQRDARRERGFLALHLSVNVGAVAGPFCGEWARINRGWPCLFSWAALGMIIGTTIMALAFRGLRNQSVPVKADVEVPFNRAIERERTRALWLLCSIAIVLWITAQQASSSLTLFAAGHTELDLFLLRRHLTAGPGHFASLHALLVLGLLPIILGCFALLRRRNAEPSTFAKMAWGYLATAAAFLVMVVASLHGGDAGRVSPLWLSSCYILLSIGELLLAPMGLTLVTRLAPPGKGSRMVGMWLATIAIGNLLAGALGMLWGRWPNHRYFALMAVLAIGTAIVILGQMRRLERVLSA